jgi:cysteine dioxygenase
LEFKSIVETMNFASIESFDQLVKNLNLGPGYGGYLDLLKAIKLPESEWKKHCQWKEQRYTRNCIASCEGYELILMCWKKGQASPIHSYDFQEGWVKVFQGQLSIDIFQVDREELRAELDEEVPLEEKEYIYLNDNMGFHRMRNTAEGDTISLHLHVEKVKQWEVWDDTKNEIILKKPRYDTFTADCID